MDQACHTLLLTKHWSALNRSLLSGFSLSVGTYSPTCPCRHTLDITHTTPVTFILRSAPHLPFYINSWCKNSLLVLIMYSDLSWESQLISGMPNLNYTAHAHITDNIFNHTWTRAWFCLLNWDNYSILAEYTSVHNNKLHIVPVERAFAWVSVSQASTPDWHFHWQCNFSTHLCICRGPSITMIPQAKGYSCPICVSFYPCF